ncbi:MAG: SDR family NAD(P)-dependent oxidoreductase [Solirubrobacteraceae bacterium]
MSLPAATPSTTVVVTGASSGIGTELARQLAELGHGLILAARRQERLDALAAELRGGHEVDVRVVAADLATVEGRAALLAAIAASGRDIVGLCNNAGFGSYGRLRELDPSREAEMVELNVVALHELTLALLGRLLDRGAGAILNVASVAAFQPLPNMATYAATKAFVQTFSEALHAELAGTGVSCTTLCPGPVPTEFGETSGADRALGALPGAVTLPPDEVAAAAVRGMVRGRRSVIPGMATKALAAGGRYVPRTALLPALRLVTASSRLRSR